MGGTNIDFVSHVSWLKICTLESWLEEERVHTPKNQCSLVGSIYLLLHEGKQELPQYLVYSTLYYI